MEKNWQRLNRERVEKKAQIADLLEKGWVSTGDLPYILERRIPKSKSTVIFGFIRKFLTAALEKQDDAYRNSNVAKLDLKTTYVSPDLASKIQEEVERYYAERPSGY